MQWIAWQLTDSALPTGGFAHSCGLESAVHQGIVSDTISLESFGKRVLSQAVSNILPFVVAGRDASMYKPPDRQEVRVEEEEKLRSQLGEWARLDRLCHATMSNHVTRRASEATGNALLRVVESTFSETSSTLKALRNYLRKDPTLRGHYAPLFGFVCGIISGGFEVPMIGRMLLFTILRDLMSAATRLSLVGPFEAATIQRRLSIEAEEIIRGTKLSSDVQMDHLTIKYPVMKLNGLNDSKFGEAADFSIAVWQTDPILDLIQGSHDQLYSRLFVS